MICSDCYDNANIYSRTREYCPYAFITEEDPLDQTLPNLMVQMPKEMYTARTQNETSALGNLLADRDVPVFLTNHDKKSDKKISSQQIIGECPLFLLLLCIPGNFGFRYAALHCWHTANLSSASSLWSNSHLLAAYSPNAHLASANNSLHPVPEIEKSDVKKMEFLNLQV